MLFLAEVPAQPERETAERDRVGGAVASALGAEWLGSLQAEGDEDCRALRDPVTDALRRARPDAIIVSAPEAGEWMPLAELVFNAAYCSTIPNYLSATPPSVDALRRPQNPKTPVI